MKVTHYDGTSFSSLKVAAGIPDDLPGPDVTPNLIERYNTTPVHAGMSRGARSIPVVFTVLPGNNAETTLSALLAALDPSDEDERVLQAQFNDGTAVYVKASLGSWVYLTVNQVQVTFYATDPAWKKTTARFSPGPDFTTWTDFTTDTSMTVQNDGQTTALPIVRLRWPGNLGSSYQRSDAGCTANFGYRRRRTITITNNGTRTLKRYPVYLDLDNTTAWAAKADGSDIRIFHNGRELPRALFGHNQTKAKSTVSPDTRTQAASSTRTKVYLKGTPLTAAAWIGAQFIITSGPLEGQSHEITNNGTNWVEVDGKFTAIVTDGQSWKIRNTMCWTVVDEIQPGNTVTLEIVYDNPQANTPPTLDAAPDMPAFDLAKSSNATWAYRTAPTAKSSAATGGRGLWHVTPYGLDPQQLSWDVPGAWQRLNYAENRDDRTQLRSTRVTTTVTTTTGSATAAGATTITIGSSPGWAANQWAGALLRITLSGTLYRRVVTSSGSNTLVVPALPSDPGSGVTVTLLTNVARFDAYRTWQDNAQYPEEGAYDGVMLSHPLGITSIEGTYTLSNPASIAKFVVVGRGSGAEDWAKELEVTTAGTAALDVDWDQGTYPVQVGFALTAADDVVIPTSYSKDSGTATSGTTTRLTDTTKAWASGQWVGGTIRLVGGTGRGPRRTITASTATYIEFASVTTAPDKTTRYILTADHKAAATIGSAFVTVSLDASLLEIGDISAEEIVYDTGKGSGTNYLTLRMGGGSGGGLYPHTLVRLGGAGKRYFLPADGQLEINANTRTVQFKPNSGTSVNVPWCAAFYRVTSAGTRLTGEWLAVKANDSKLWVSNPNWAGSNLAVQVELEEAFLG